LRSCGTLPSGRRRTLDRPDEKREVLEDAVSFCAWHSPLTWMLLVGKICWRNSLISVEVWSMLIVAWLLLE